MEPVSPWCAQPGTSGAAVLQECGGAGTPNWTVCPAPVEGQSDSHRFLIAALVVLICCLANNFKHSKENLLVVVLLFGAPFP